MTLKTLAAPGNVSPSGQPRSTGSTSRPDAPHAPRRPRERTVHGENVVTGYRWLRDPFDPRTISHAEAENAYTARRTAGLERLRAVLTREVLPRRSGTAAAVPVLHDGWWYIERPAEGTIELSRMHELDVDGGIGTAPAVGTEASSPREQSVLTNHRGVVGVTLSLRQDRLVRADATPNGCDLTVFDLPGGEILDRAVHGAGPESFLSTDSRWLLYTRLDDIGRSHQLRAHRIGEAGAEDVLLLEEPDQWASVEISRSRDASTLVVRSTAPRTATTWMLSLDDPTAPPRRVTTGRGRSRCQVEHAGDRLLVLPQDPTARMLLGEAPLDWTGDASDVTTVLEARQGDSTGSVVAESAEAFAGFIALQVRADGLPGVRVIPRRTDGSLDVRAVRRLGHGGPLDAVRLDVNPSWTQTSLRYRLESLITPFTVARIDVVTGETTVLHQDEMPGHAPERYREQRVWATSPDGTRIPISLLSRRDVLADGTAPGLLYGEGAFGVSLDPSVDPAALALADRGLVVAIAHVRGGGEMGSTWHRAGRHLAKATSFDDFVAAGNHLVSTGLVSPERLGAAGIGAGGLLVAASTNLAPGLFRAVVAGAPQADPLESLLDPEVMLTLEEWMEWGDPAGDEAAYRCLRDYSPAENIRAEEYPAVYAWTARDGTDVPFGEAAVWISQLRATVTSDPEARPVLLRCLADLQDGGVGVQVEAMAWLLDQLGASVADG
ncbi:prolyl oligopeptidase family serine peptidase [Brachybacterium sp. JB7]|uniref:prolyl oligopeptidase family serine peptidase n=1 Tax=Brachybacterium sp. JB7 TaxID=2024478 RepID=UPI001314F755|nr:prolyl oligopeptidase family serine peptidase [Brachybacterium sp. JB7]